MAKVTFLILGFAELDSINSISQKPHGWTSFFLGKLSVDPCYLNSAQLVLFSSVSQIGTLETLLGRKMAILIR